MARRRARVVAARREALTWRRVEASTTPGGLLAYLRRYPRGPHADVRGAGWLFDRSLRAAAAI